ncbi:MAG TPA: DUF5054 domain-containing protein [Candidatus Sulfomarinibacteraceae bacterium]|nr:DUF5054 domain-containing protein [Candidatus Sulfomarinibacteraceae bacterium]
MNDRTATTEPMGQTESRQAHSAQPRKVHLVFKTHLDLGFTELANSVVRRYFTHFIPQALATARALRRRQRSERFVWTTGSWLIYEFLEQANSAQRAEMEEAILAGDITWHALPFTTHTELMDASLFDFGLTLSHELDRRFGRQTIAAKMTDVPGHTRAMVPLLARHGVRFLHLGVNPASTAPDVPDVFRWQAPGGEEIIVAYSRTAYGSPISVPGLDEMLLFAHSNDNLGPQSEAEIVEQFARLRQSYPQAQIEASDLNSFAQALEAARPTLQATLPLVTSEIGDTWIHGAGSDPAKVAGWRALSRLRRRALQETPEIADDSRFRAFSRALLLVPEHTWGLDEKTHLADYERYSRAHFQALRDEPQTAAFAASWSEQRAYVQEALDALDDLPLRQEALQAIKDTVPRRPDLTGYETVEDLERSLDTARFSIQFDPASGAIISLQDREGGRHWATADAPLGWLRYQTLNERDYERFMDQYLTTRPDWALRDFSKPGLESAAAESGWWQVSLSRLLERADEDAHRFLLEMTLPQQCRQRYGAPGKFYLSLTAPHDEATLYFELQWFEKAANRQPEALWFSFCPRLPAPERWLIEKMGMLISPLDVVPKGNRRLHAVDRGAFYDDGQVRLTIETLDAPLLAPGAPSLLNFTDEQPSLQEGLHFNLYNNVWGTNFPMWYEDDARFRFILRFH